MNKFKKGDKVEYINFYGKKVCVTIIKYVRVKTIVCKQEIINIFAKLSNEEIVNSRFLKKIKKPE